MLKFNTKIGVKVLTLYNKNVIMFIEIRNWEQLGKMKGVKK